jgi:16S rRNA (cytosine967-C5)-methyltransferase
MKGRKKVKHFPLKYHKFQFLQIHEILKDIFDRGARADKAIERIMRKNKRWKPRERSFVSDTTYDIIRNWRLLFTVANLKDELHKKDFWTIVAAWMVFRTYDLPHDDSHKHVQQHEIEERLMRFANNFKIRESYSDEMDEIFGKQLGRKTWEMVATAMNNEPRVYIRTNRLRISPEELIADFAEEKIPAMKVDGMRDAIELEFTRNVFRTQAFKKGWFEVQDINSQRVSLFLDVKEGMRVIDACAGAGGKALHLACLMKNRGKIIALDVKKTKLDELRKRASRSEISIIETRLIDNTKVTKRLNDSADRVLLDVPCSGSGVYRRNPDAKWNFKPEELKDLQARQDKLLNDYSSFCKIGGKLVYAVCSILPSEGEERVKSFIKTHPNWEFEGEKKYLPGQDEGDGFYMALLTRKK